MVETFVTDVGAGVDVGLGQLPQSAEHAEQFSFSDASQIPFPQLGAVVGVGEELTVGVDVGSGVGVIAGVGGEVGVAVGVGF